MELKLITLTLRYINRLHCNATSYGKTRKPKSPELEKGCTVLSLINTKNSMYVKMVLSNTILSIAQDIL